MTINTSGEPFYDDYDKHKHFYKILFRPAYALQTRELTQMQTILQEQIRRAGDHLFKNGTMVIPGELSFNTEFQYVKLDPMINSSRIADYLTQLNGLVIEGATSGVQAQVIVSNIAEGNDPDTIFVSYLTKGPTGARVFSANEILTPIDPTKSGLAVLTSSAPTGIGSGVSVGEGVYYINGHFVLCEAQTIVLDKYTNTPTYSIGFEIAESIVTPEDDESLLDNAQGTYNFAAPGAHRFAITLTLTKRTDYNDAADPTRYIQLTSLLDGVPQTPFNITQYAELAKVMARRTYDESGDYVVKEFGYNVREHRSNNRGTWATATAYELGDIVSVNNNSYTALNSGTSGAAGISGTWPTDPLTIFSDSGVDWRFTLRPKYNGGLSLTGDKNSFALAIDAGRAYVKGYEIEKIATTYHKVDKALEFNVSNDTRIDALAGNYVEVRNVVGLPDLQTMQQVNLYSIENATVGTTPTIGTAWVRAFEFHSGTIGNTLAVYKLGLFDITLNASIDFSRDVKCIAATGFTCNINPKYITQEGTVSTSGSSTTLLGVGTLFTTLKAGDLLDIFESSATTRVKVNSIPTVNNSLTLSSAVNITAASRFALVVTDIQEPQNSNLIFFLPNYVKDIRDSTGVNDIKYAAFSTFTGVTTDASGIATINISTVTGGASNTFGSVGGVGNYICSLTTGIVPVLGVVLSVGNTQATIDLGIANASLTGIKIIALIERASSSGNEKTKTLTYTSLPVTIEAIGTSKVITLEHADVKSIFSVKMKSGTWAAPVGAYSIDITSRFVFDDGQTDSYYGLGSISIGEGQALPTAPYEITYAYFAHVGTGDYFTISSYGNIKESYIPTFNGVSLRHAIDFRPRISSSLVSDRYVPGDFIASASHMPIRSGTLTLAYRYYLPRIDKIALDLSGKFTILTGIPELNPKEKDTPATAMHLSTIMIGPHTANVKSSVKINQIDNRRYTMRDIGTLDRRITNLEQYTTMSLVETNTASMNILDENGLSRFKNGFIVDPFNGHGIGDSRAEDYRCSVDQIEKVLRPISTIDNIELFEKNTANRAANGYVMTGDLITLPYTETNLISQTMASRTENVNPYAVYAFIGKCILNPVSDDWMETEWSSPVTTYIDDGYNSAIDANGGMAMNEYWNSWQTTWTGVPYISQAATKASSEFVTGGVKTSVSVTDWNSSTQITTSTTAKVKTSTYLDALSVAYTERQTGLRTEVKSITDVSRGADTTVSADKIQYMRARNISFVLKGLKGSTKLYSKFDSIDVSRYITPATLIRVDDINGASHDFDCTSYAGDNANVDARKIGNTLDLSLNKGHILKGGTSGATAVIMFIESRAVSQTYTNLYIINISGTFVTGEILYATMNGVNTSNIRGTLYEAPTTISSAYKLNVLGDELFSNHSGVACGLFSISNNRELRFLTGYREFELTDEPIDSTIPPTTSAKASYSAMGILETKHESYVSTRRAEIIETKLDSGDKARVKDAGTQTRVETTTIANASQVVTYVDPLAQTFVVDSRGGAFITSANVYFRTVDESIPIRMEIREVVNGMPATSVLPFSTKYKFPNEITVSETGAVPTTFIFDSLVYLEEGKEYAIVLISDSNNYNVYISEMGGVDLLTGKDITSQPSLGVLFKSSNASTWTANQLQDLKFDLKKAVFDINTTGYVTFANKNVDNSYLINNPIYTTTGSNLVKVYHIDHGMFDGSSVTLSGFSTANGIDAAKINKTHVISNVDLDSYTITTDVADPGTILTGPCGGITIIASRNILFNLINVSTSQIEFQNTSIEYSMLTTTGSSVDGSETPYVKSTSPILFKPSSNIEFTAPCVIGSAINESASILAGAKSLEVTAMLKTANKNISPVIDIQRLSAILVSNKINSPTLANTNVAVIDERSIVAAQASKIGFDAALNSFYIDTSVGGNATEVAKIQTLAIGKYVTISGSLLDGGVNNGNALVVEHRVVGNIHNVIVANKTLSTVVANTDAITITSNEKFVDEIAPMFGTALNKYISKEIILSNPSTHIRTNISVNLPPLADIEFYYRTNTVGSAKALSTLNWTRMEPSSAIKKNSRNTYVDASFDVSNIPSFDTLQVKIVMKSNSIAQVPKCKQLRIIATA